MGYEFIFFVLIFAYAQGELNVNVKAAENAKRSSISFAGEAIAPVDYRDFKLFKLTNDSIKDAVAKKLGKRPDHVWFSDPCGNRNMYEANDWPAFVRVLKPTRAQIENVRQFPQSVLSMTMNNNSSSTMTCKGGLEQTVTNSVEATASISNKVTTNIEVKFTFGFAEFGTDWTFSTEIGKEFSKSKDVVIGSGYGFEMEIEKNEVKIASLSCTRGTMDILMDYIWTLTGCIGLGFDKKVGSEVQTSYSCMPIHDILKVTGERDKKPFSATMRVSYYSDSQIIVSDAPEEKEEEE